MSKDAAGKAAPVSKDDLSAMSPTVSVAEALNLPSDWSLAKSLGGVVTKKNPTDVDAHADEDELPEGAEDEGGDEDEKPAEEKPAEEKPVEEKPLVKPGEKPASKKPLVKPKPGEKPAVEKPAGEKPTGEKPAEEKPVVIPVKKIKVGDKDYTQEELDELKKLLGGGEKPAAVAATRPAGPEKKEPTPEEAEISRVAVQKKDREWVASVAPNVDVEIDEPLLDKIITGGAEAVKAFTQVLQTSVARAVLMTRKSMYAELEPRFNQISAQQTPLMEAFERQENDRMWSEFQKEYKDLAKDRDLVEQAASYLASNEPERVAQLSEKEFYAECAAGVRGLKIRFGLKEVADGEKPAEEPPAGGEKPVEKKPTIPAARSPVKPPGGNLPAAKAPAGAGKKQGDPAIADLMAHDQLW